ncbi:MAG TPA: TonB-dependent receptor, partial [Planctomycetaceae bacterium]
DTIFKFAIDIYDLEFRQNLKHAETHTFTWGAGYRVIHDNIDGNGFMNPAVDTHERTYDQASAFLQEEMPLFRDDLKLVIGSKFLFWYFTGFEYQPTARLLWEIDEKHVAWGAVSRAVRLPMRAEEDLSVLASAGVGLPLFSQTLGGGRGLVSEELLAYELGYRQQVTDKLSFELATFYNVYRNLINFTPIGFVPGFPPIVQSQVLNLQNAAGYGCELNGQWELTDKWKLRAWYSFLKLQVNGPGTLYPPGAVPRNQAYMMSSWDLPKNLELDLMTRYVDNLSAISVDSYVNLDARLGWRPNMTWEFSIIGQNLLAPHHLEFVGLTTVPSAVNRGIYAQVTWRH